MQVLDWFANTYNKLSQSKTVEAKKATELIDAVSKAAEAHEAELSELLGRAYEICPSLYEELELLTNEETERLKKADTQTIYRCKDFESTYLSLVDNWSSFGHIAAGWLESRGLKEDCYIWKGNNLYISEKGAIWLQLLCIPMMSEKYSKRCLKV